jgi:hypothetical protein
MPSSNEKGRSSSIRSRLRSMRVARVLRDADKRPLIIVVLALVVGLAAVYSLSPRYYNLTEGVVAQHDVYAPRDYTWHDEEETEQARAQAARDVTKIYVGSRPQAFQEMVQRLGAIFNVIEATAADVRLAQEERVSDEMDMDEPPGADGEQPEDNSEVEETASEVDEIIQGAWDLLDPTYRPSYGAFAAAVRMEPDDRDALRQACQRALSRLNEERDIRNDELAGALDQIRERLGYWAEVRALGVPDAEGVRQAFVGICAACIVPNSIYDNAATERQREQVAAEVPPIMKSIKQGELIVSQGTVVTAEDVKRLKVFGMVAEQTVDWTPRLLDLGMALVTLAMAMVVIYHFEPKSLMETRRLFALAILIGVPTIAFNVMVNQENLPHVGYALTQFAVLAATVLLGHFTAACLSGVLLVCFLIIAGPASLHGMWGVLAGAVTGMVAARYLTYRLTHVTALGVASSVFAFASVGFVDLYLERRMSLGGQTMLTADYTADLLLQARWSLVAGLTGVFGGYLASRCLEYSLETVTDMRLLELSDPSHPLLELLLAKAPGTYHGSLLVSNIAGNAAKSIGRDHEALLVRVGALYHDIGKTERPHMFVENQGGGANPHDTLSPTLSARSIIAHVTEGVKLAEKHRLPRPIVDCIKEHHGTTLVAYFFHRAQELGLEDVTEEQFRYPGPKPRSVATGVLMLADTVEAAVRSLQNPTRNAIETQVRKVVESKLQDGQLDECPLTMQEIKAVQGSLINTLLGIYHARIEYPEMEEKGEAKAEKAAPKPAQQPGGNGDGAAAPAREDSEQVS